MRRVGRLLVGVSAALMFLVFGVSAGDGSRSTAPLVLAIPLAVALVWWGWTVAQRRRPPRPEGWSSTAQAAYQRASTTPGRARARVPIALARVEARELASSPAFGAGLGFCALALFFFGRVWAGDFGGDAPLAFELTPILTHPLAGMVVLASFRGRTRARRDGLEELLTTCPVSDRDRTLGHLLTAWVPALVGLAFAVLLATLIADGAPTTFGTVGARQLAAAVGAGVLCAGAVCLGVALARWLPWTIVPVAAVVAVGFAATNLATRGTRTTEPMRALSTFLVDPELDLRLTAPHWLAHHAWIAGLAVLVALVALLRDQRDRSIAAVGVLTVSLTVWAGVAATRPVSTADARRIAALVGDPTQQPCRDAGGLAVCTYAGDRRLAAALVDTVRPVADAAPPGALGGWSVMQGFDVRRHHLDPEVQALLTDTRPAHVLPIEFTGHPLALEGLRLWVGLTAVGTFDDAEPVRGAGRDLSGQARGVVALWPATRGADRDVQLDLTSLGTPQRSGRDTGRPWPDTCFAGPAPAVWAASDVAAARGLLGLPEAAVLEVLHGAWEHYVSPATTTDELLRALGLAELGVTGRTGGTGEC